MSEAKKAIVLAENHYEDLELHYPRLRLIEAGFDVQVAGPEKGGQYTSKHGYPVVADLAYEDVSPEDVQVLIIPGGYAPDHMRRHPSCIELVAGVNAAGGIIGAICHAGWMLISAKIVDGRRMTSFFAIKDDLVNAGADWVDDRCVRDGNLITAQTPPDLPAFMQQILEAK